MSDPTISYGPINDAGRTLASLLFHNLVNDSTLSSIFNGNDILEKQVTLASPKEIETNNTESSAKLSIYLYNITEFSAMKNTPPTPPNQNPPIYLTLHYLITPFSKAPNSDQNMLSRIIQTFLDNPVMKGTILKGNLADDGDLRVTLNSLKIDDLNKIWTMLSSPYRVSLSYSVSPVRIEPSWQPEEKLVIEKTALHKQKKPGET